MFLYIGYQRNTYNELHKLLIYSKNKRQIASINENSGILRQRHSKLGRRETCYMGGHCCLPILLLFYAFT